MYVDNDRIMASAITQAVAAVNATRAASSLAPLTDAQIIATIKTLIQANLPTS
jgi:hypothetical protein